MNKIIKSHLVIVIIVVTFLAGCEEKQVPTVVTADVSDITGTTATSGGIVTDEGSSAVLSRGVCYSTGTKPTLGDNKTTEGSGAGFFSSNITGLKGAAVYYIRAYASNSEGTGYGMVMALTTLGQSPLPAVANATNITVTSATLNGSVNPYYLLTEVTFEYGTTTSYGSTASAMQNPVTGAISINVSSDITGLDAATIYHCRIKAVNSLGTTYSDDLTFTTIGLVPSVTTFNATSITTTGSTLNGRVNANYLSTVVTFEYGKTTSYGSTVTATQSPVTGSSDINVSANNSGLTAGTAYHFRIKAENSLGTSYGSDQSFTTSIIDVEGNTYYTITIGTQVWMAENLKTTKYNDGTSIPNITGFEEWREASTGAYCDYENTPSNSITYGRLYSWYAVDNNALSMVESNGGKNVCPTAWHVPNDAEWTTLTDYLTNNGYGYEGNGNDIAKSMAATSGWSTSLTPGSVGNDQASNNSSGFTALPSGWRYGTGDPTKPFTGIGSGCSWWSSSVIGEVEFSAPHIFSQYSTLYFFSGKGSARSVRCLRDQ